MEQFPLLLCDCRHGRMLVPADDTIIGRALALYGEFAEAVPRLLCSALAPGDVAVDVGANLGSVTLPMARAVGTGGQVFAFEPQRALFGLLCLTVNLNGLSQVRPVQAGLAERAGLMFAPLAEAVSGVNQGAVALSSGVEFGSDDPVAVLPLDALELSRCKVIKIDVEGMELAVLRGAAATIARCRPILYLEAHGGPGTTACFEWLAAAGYRCWWHLSPFWEADNYVGRADSIFAASGDVNAVAVPQEWGVDLDLPPVSDVAADWSEDLNDWLASRGDIEAH